MFTNLQVEENIEECVKTVSTVEFLHGVPVGLPSEYKASLRGAIRKVLSQALTERDREIVDEIEGMKLKNHNAIDKLPETDERARITNLLNENLQMGYQIALSDIKALLTPRE